jgi:hypothetical protein
MQMKFLKIAGVTSLVLIALAVLGVSFAFAQTPNQPDNSWWNTMRSMIHPGVAAACGATTGKEAGFRYIRDGDEALNWQGQPGW